MKKILLSVAAFVAAVFTSSADEGMWLLPLLQKMNSKAMSEIGCKLTPEQIYSINNSSIKDAIVHFGGGCTGEVISGEGLLVTNHHCGYSSIQGLSTPEHNYLEDGFWAMNRSQEMPVPGLTVTFLESMTDVTPVLEKARKEALKAYKDSTNKEELADKAVRESMKMLEAAAESDNSNVTASVRSFFNSNVYYLIISKVYRDVRFVGAPPAASGKFGGETDNWMWPRHTCDFSMFRIYANADNEPAEYSENNVPYTPKQFLTISLKGVQDNDYAMVIGYPGRTQRYQTAAQLNNMIATNRIRIDARTTRQRIMMEGMQADPTVRLQYANKYASSSNGWKKWQGEELAFEKLNIIGREEEKEAELTKWINKNNKRKAAYGHALGDIAEAVESGRESGAAWTLYSETLLRIGIVSAVQTLNYAIDAARKKGLSEEEALAEGIAEAEAVYKDFDGPLERKLTAGLLEYYRKNADSKNWPNLGEGVDFATLDIDKFVDNLFNNSNFASLEKLRELKSKTAEQIQEDPAEKFYVDIYTKALEIYQAGADRARDEKLSKASKAYAAALLDWQKGDALYPDANSTMRLTYGTVKSYSPKDAVIYKHFTTLDGVMEKEDPDNYEFRVPAKVKSLWQAKDFGQYADADGRLHTCFLTTNDITGGNSGSPVLNGNGELIGLAFDGNWESMSSDVMFEPDLQRCIAVDIRYVLFMMDKFGGAGYLLNEMHIVK